MNLKSKFKYIFSIIFTQDLLNITFLIIEYTSKSSECVYYWFYFLIDSIIKFLCLFYPVIILKNGLNIHKYFIVGGLTEISLYLSNLISPLVLVINYALPSRQCDNNIILINAIFATISSILCFFLFKNTVKQDYQDLNLLRECIICFENIEIANELKLSCGHYYHKECILEWGVKQPKCPICRHEFSIFIN